MRKLFGSFMLVGFLILLGSAGASDLNAIDFTTAMVYGLIGLGLMFVGGRGLEMLDK